jgi:GT2 family glycosyltransferase
VVERRHLLGVLVYNGRGVVRRCLESLAPLVGRAVDVVVFDDCSPSPGWSADVEAMCDELGIGYYRSPRNLGIPRNMNLVMKLALDRGHDVATLVNSDVVVPHNLVQVADEILDADPMVASITPWSNNVSAFSLPMASAHPTIASPHFVDEFSAALHRTFGSTTAPIPTGVGYCLMMPTDVIRDTGLMDPIFGRGYCEEVDWCQRARRRGRHHVLGLGSFVYHEGSVTNREEGLLNFGATTVSEHELIIAHRYPDYHGEVTSFLTADPLEPLRNQAISTGLHEMVRGNDCDVVITSAAAVETGDRPALLVSGHGDGPAPRLCVHGISTAAHPTLRTPESLGEALGIRIVGVRLEEPGSVTDRFGVWARTMGVPLIDRACYPNSV